MRKALSLLAVIILFLSTSPPSKAQDKRPVLVPNKLVTFSLEPNEQRIFLLRLKQDEFAEISWLANDDVNLDVEIRDATNRILETRGSIDEDSAVFISPKDGEYKFLVKFEKSPDVSSTQRISLEYSDVFRMPSGTKQKDIRRVNGYDVKIMAPVSFGGDPKSIVLFEKAGRLKKIWKQFGGESIGPTGYYFSDEVVKTDPVTYQRSASLVGSTSDKTGDGIPDLMINYVSGGAHCCVTSLFVNLGETVELVELVTGDVEPIRATAKSIKGGLVFELPDTDLYCFNFPNIVLSFVGGKLLPDFARMKKGPPSLASLKSKGRFTSTKLGFEPYIGGDAHDGCGLFKEGEKEIPFWSDMINLMISDRAQLAWQYLDLVWPEGKPGKEIFIAELKEKLSASRFWRELANQPK